MTAENIEKIRLLDNVKEVGLFHKIIETGGAVITEYAPNINIKSAFDYSSFIHLLDNDKKYYNKNHEP